MQPAQMNMNINMNVNVNMNHTSVRNTKHCFAASQSESPVQPNQAIKQSNPWWYPILAIHIVHPPSIIILVWRYVISGIFLPSLHHFFFLLFLFPCSNFLLGFVFSFFLISITPCNHPCWGISNMGSWVGNRSPKEPKDHSGGEYPPAGNEHRNKAEL